MGWTRGAAGEEPRRQEWVGNSCARTLVTVWTDTAELRDNMAVFPDAKVLRCSMLRCLKSVEACTWWSGTHRTQQSGAPLEIVGRRQLQHQGGGKSLAEPPSGKESLSPFTPVASARCHNSFVDTSYLLLQMSAWPRLLFFYFPG